MSQILKLNVQEELTLEEIKHILSMCGEYNVKQEGVNIEITKVVSTPTDFVNDKFVYEYKNISTLVYKPTIQTLIRDISGLGWREKEYREQEEKL